MTTDQNATVASTGDLVASYAKKFFAELSDGSHMACSALGAWLLLALIAPASEGTTRSELETWLGCLAEDAQARATALLDAPHGAVASALALWTRAGSTTDNFASWATSLPTTLEHGPIPSQEVADAWADEHTLGLIKAFPTQLDALTMIVFANALACKISWHEPFDVVPTSDAPGSFSDAGHVLRGDNAFLAQTTAAGIVGCYLAEAEGMGVLSVIAGPKYSAADTHAAALELIGVATQRFDHWGGKQISLFDLPLEDGHCWSIREYTETRSSRGNQAEEAEAYLPAWDVPEATHKLLAVQVGFQPAAAVAGSFLTAEHQPAEVDAVQAVRARYTKTGFEAAAITAISVRAASMPPQPHDVLVRKATLAFDRAHTAVAIAYGNRWQADQPEVWNNVPVFSAWICDWSDADELDSIAPSDEH